MSTPKVTDPPRARHSKPELTDAQWRGVRIAALAAGMTVPQFVAYALTTHPNVVAELPADE